MSAPVTVAGGTDSIAADFEQLAAFASALDAAADSIAGVLAVLARCLGDPALIGAAVLDPAGAAEILALAGVATAGAAVALARCQSLSAVLRLAAGSYRAADELDRRVVPVLAAGYRLPRVLPPLAGSAGSGTGWKAALRADPGLVDLAVQVLTIAGTGGVPLPGGTARLAGLLATPFPDGTAVVTTRPTAPTGDRDGPPRGAADLLAALALRGSHNEGGGSIDVRTLDGAGGRRVIVDITGTTAWNFDPARRAPEVSDLGTNLRALANRSSVFERGVLQALRQAGVRPGEPIMLVGHSQGGMIAARLAAQLPAAEFTVTHLVTAGAPIGLAAVPGSVSVLSLQNQGDIVPELDGADNPRRANWVTVRTARGGEDSGLSRHSVRSYLAGAHDVDACADPSLAHWRRTAAGFLDADRISTQVFQIRRAD